MPYAPIPILLSRTRLLFLLLNILVVRLVQILIPATTIIYDRLLLLSIRIQFKKGKSTYQDPIRVVTQLPSIINRNLHGHGFGTPPQVVVWIYQTNQNVLHALHTRRSSATEVYLASLVGREEASLL